MAGFCKQCMYTRDDKALLLQLYCLKHVKTVWRMYPMLKAASLKRQHRGYVKEEKKSQVCGENACFY